MAAVRVPLRRVCARLCVCVLVFGGVCVAARGSGRVGSSLTEVDDAAGATPRRAAAQAAAR